MGLCVLTPLPLLGLPTTSPSPPAPPSSPPSLLPPPLILSRSLVASEGLPVEARLAELREPPRSTHPSPTLFLFSYENPGWKEVLGYERFHPDPTPSTNVTRSGWFALPEHRILLCKWGGGGPNSSHEAQWREICVVRTDALPHAGHEQAISSLPLPFR